MVPRRPRFESPAPTAVAALLWVALLALPAPAADPIKVGPEIEVSSSYADYFPRIASDVTGNFMVVWESDAAVKARRFYADGNEHLAEFQLSTPAHYLGTDGSTSTGNVGVAGDASGNFVVTYGATNYEYVYNGYPLCYESPCVWTRRNDANGNTAPATFMIQDPTQTYVDSYFGGGHDQVSNPEISALGNGEFVVVWEGYDKYPRLDDPGTFGSDESAFAAKTVSIGQKKGQYFRVNTYDSEYQGQYGDFAAAGGKPDGSFVIAFRSEYFYYYGGGKVPGGNIRAQLYDKNGKPVGTEFGTSIDDDTYGHDVDVAANPNGTFMLVWQDDGVHGRVFLADGTPVTDDFEVATSGYYPAIAASADAFVVLWTDDEVMGERFDLAGNSLSNEFQVNTTPDGYWGDVAAAQNGNFIATWKHDGYARAQRFRVEPTNPIEMPVFGKNLIITNKLPEDPEKSRGKWKAGGENIASPPRGTASDPRCNGAPDGTVKAAIRFWSDATGHDSGTIPLPCQHWKAIGSKRPSGFAKRGYKYSDGQHESGPCTAITIKGTKSLSVVCKGRKGLATFPYDLEVGTNEVEVNALLELGIHRYCSTFPPFNEDGSSGKKFKGKNAAAPAGPCPAGVLGQCGNGVVGIDEVCDDGNSSDGDYCSADCKTATSVCGDGIVELLEACDDGNTADGDYCSGDCFEITAVCGDSIVGPGEACDDGNTSGGDYCSANCKFETAICGDSIVGPGEACDDGNTSPGDYCRGDCKAITAICGDGVIGPGEVCDDGNTNNGDLCSADCKTETANCGDGIVGPGEACDDGNTVDGDYCSADCTTETAICGDSHVSPGEACDDGNTDDGDYCSGDCTAETAICGDSLVGPGEACDDGNTADGDYCSADCTAETAVCGDSIVGPGEECDDGNTSGGDLCAADCTTYTPICGDGIVTPGECCDDGNAIGGDGCAATCDSGSLCPVQSPPIAAYHRGWWRSDGAHGESNDNTYTGGIGSSRQYNSFFVFDLGGLSGTVTAATLRLEVERYYGSSPSETLSVWDVTTPTTTLIEDGSGATEIYTDLQSGQQLGGFVVVPADDGSVKEIQLNAPALAYLTSRLGSDVAVGVHVDTLDIGSGNEGVRFSAGGDFRVHELVLSILP